MRKSEGNMYSFISCTWNPIRGKCLHGCSYCYMKRFKQKEIHLDAKVLAENLGEGRRIFVGSGTDIFSPDVPIEWIGAVIHKMNQYKNEYLLQSKNSMRMLYYYDKVPKETIFCTTMESNWNYPDIFCKAPIIQMRYAGIKSLKNVRKKVMVTVEPILDFDVLEFSSMLISLKPDQVNIGADSKKHNLPEPSWDKVDQLIKNLERQRIPVIQKENLKRLCKG